MNKPTKTKLYHLLSFTHLKLLKFQKFVTTHLIRSLPLHQITLTLFYYLRLNITLNHTILVLIRLPSSVSSLTSHLKTPPQKKKNVNSKKKKVKIKITFNFILKKKLLENSNILLEKKYISLEKNLFFLY